MCIRDRQRTVEYAVDLDFAADGIIGNKLVLLVRVGAPDVHMVHPVGNGVELAQQVPGFVAVEAVVYNVAVLDHVQGLLDGDEF